MENNLAEYQEYIKNKTGNMPYPNKVDFTTLYVYDKGVVVYRGKKSEYENKSLVKMTSETAVDEQGYKEAMEKYRVATNKANNEWQKDVFEYVGADMANKQHSALYSIIYQDHHSSMADVFYKFEEYFNALFTN